MNLIFPIIFLFSVASMAQDDCSKDDFVYQQFELQQCIEGGHTQSCKVIPKGSISTLLGGAAGYVGGRAVGDKIAANKLDAYSKALAEKISGSKGTLVDQTENQRLSLNKTLQNIKEVTKGKNQSTEEILRRYPEMKAKIDEVLKKSNMGELATKSSRVINQVNSLYRQQLKESFERQINEIKESVFGAHKVTTEQEKLLAELEANVTQLKSGAFVNELPTESDRQTTSSSGSNKLNQVQKGVQILSDDDFKDSVGEDPESVKSTKVKIISAPKPSMSASAIEVESLSIDRTLAKGIKLLQQNHPEASRSMLPESTMTAEEKLSNSMQMMPQEQAHARARAMGARAGAGLGAGVMAVAPAAAALVTEQLRFSKCIENKDWYKPQQPSDNAQLMSLVDMWGDCTTEVKPSVLAELINKSEAERKKYFSECPNCCRFMKKRNQEMIAKIDDFNPTVIMSKENCASDSFQADVIMFGHKYHQTYQRVGNNFELKTPIIPGSQPNNNGNLITMEIHTVRDNGTGRLTNQEMIEPKVYAPGSAEIMKSYEGIPGQPAVQAMLHDYDYLTASGRLPENQKDLKDNNKVRYSIVEQLTAASLSFQSIKAFCEQALGSSPGASGKDANGVR